MQTAGPRALLLLGLLAATACRDPAGPSAILSDRLAVYGAIEVGSDRVMLLAEYLTELGGQEPLRGAAATVTGASGSVALSESPPGTWVCFPEPEDPGPIPPDDACYTGALPQPTVAGETLTLDMALPDGRRITGTVVSPERPTASIPPDSQTVSVFAGARGPLDNTPRATVPIVLHSAPGASRVDVVATVAGTPPGACTMVARTAPFLAPRLEGTHDWNIYELPICRAGVSYGSGGRIELEIHVIAMDDNYAGYMNHVLGSTAVDVTRAGFGLEGAVGVFGATATTVLSLALIPDS